VLSQAVDLSQQMTKFLLAEIAEQRAKRLLCGNGQDGAAGSRKSRFSPRDVAKEGLNRRQPRVARADGVAAAGLQVREKVQHHGSREILYNELIDGAATPRGRKLKQELYCIPI
jgi:hypothetical protein